MDKNYLNWLEIDLWKERNNASLLNKLSKKVRSCLNCSLSQKRSQVCLGKGDENASLMLILEAPYGKETLSELNDEDKLLIEIFKAIDLKKNNIYTAYLLKCVGKTTLEYSLEEMNACVPYLDEQIELIKPKFILSLGEKLSQFLLKTDKSIENIRSDLNYYKKTPLFSSYDLSYILKNPLKKREVYQDLLKLKKFILSVS